MTNQLELAWDTRCATGESVVWDPARRRVMFCDIPAGRIFALAVDTGARTTWDLRDGDDAAVCHLRAGIEHWAGERADAGDDGPVLPVRAWLDRHPRWTFHFVPTSCSWLNAVEGFFAKLTRRRLKNGVFHSVVDLQAAINRFIKEHNQQPRPFVWRADPDQIIAAVRRGHQTLESIH